MNDGILTAIDPPSDDVAPSLPSPAVLFKNKANKSKCICKWGPACVAIQTDLREFCVARRINHVALGLTRIATSGAPNNQRLLKSAMKHLVLDQATVIAVKAIFVARHHFPLLLLEYNGIHQQTVDGVVLPTIVGANNKVAKFYTALPYDKAHEFGINEELDRFCTDKSNAQYNNFVQAPLAPYSVVCEYINSLIPSS